MSLIIYKKAMKGTALSTLATIALGVFLVACLG